MLFPDQQNMLNQEHYLAKSHPGSHSMAISAYISPHTDLNQTHPVISAELTQDLCSFFQLFPLVWHPEHAIQNLTLFEPSVTCPLTRPLVWVWAVWGMFGGTCLAVINFNVWQLIFKVHLAPLLVQRWHTSGTNTLTQYCYIITVIV